MLCIGLMSGTSMDGIDAALMRTDGLQLIEQLATYSLSYDPAFKLALREAENLVQKHKKNIASKEVIEQSTKLHAKAVHELLKQAGLSASDVNLIGYHGQALYHAPKDGITIQIGDAQLLANLTQIAVVNDFRSDDVANGGQGAPLAPLYHQALLKKKNYLPAAIVNCGGIANISLIHGDKESEVIGFDTGPGNVLIDRYIRLKTDNAEFIDLNGKYGLKGKVNQDILTKLIASIAEYLAKPFPKSLDPGDFHLISELDKLSIYDACATLENFTAFCIANCLPSEQLPRKWLLVGGGWHNPVITKYLREYLSQKIDSPDIKTASEVGLDSEYMEAELFAYLAVRSFNKLPISLISVTGAKIPSYGGTIYFPEPSF